MCCERLLCDRSSPCYSSGNLIEAVLRNAARECPGSRGEGGGLKKSPEKREGSLHSALAEKPNKYLDANMYDSLFAQLLGLSGPFQLSHQANH